MIIAWIVIPIVIAVSIACSYFEHREIERVEKWREEISKTVDELRKWVLWLLMMIWAFTIWTVNPISPESRIIFAIYCTGFAICHYLDKLVVNTKPDGEKVFRDTAKDLRRESKATANRVKKERPFYKGE